MKVSRREFMKLALGAAAAAALPAPLAESASLMDFTVEGFCAPLATQGPWDHIAVSRINGGFKFYVNAVEVVESHRLIRNYAPTLLREAVNYLPQLVGVDIAECEEFLVDSYRITSEVARAPEAMLTQMLPHTPTNLFNGFISDVNVETFAKYPGLFVEPDCPWPAQGKEG